MNKLERLIEKIRERIEGTIEAQCNFEAEIGDREILEWEWEEIKRYSLQIGIARTILRDAEEILKENEEKD